MRVWVYPEKKYEELGATRYQVSWEDVRQSAMRKVGTDEDWDHDEDIESRYANFVSKEKGMAYARKMVMENDRNAYGCATVTRQVVDWYVEEDKVAEWADTSETEEVTH